MRLEGWKLILKRCKNSPKEIITIKRGKIHTLNSNSPKDNDTISKQSAQIYRLPVCTVYTLYQARSHLHRRRWHLKCDTWKCYYGLVASCETTQRQRTRNSYFVCFIRLQHQPGKSVQFGSKSQSKRKWWECFVGPPHRRKIIYYGMCLTWAVMSTENEQKQVTTKRVFKTHSI